MAKATDIPRWAKELGETTWERINELLYDGWQPAAVRAELNLPESKKRSLEQYARKFRYRRILAPVARMRELLAGGAASIGPDALKLLTLVVSQSLSPETDEAKRARAAQVLLEYVGLVERIGQRAEEAEAKREQQEQGQPTEDAAAMLRRVARDVFGVVGGGDHATDG